MSRGFSEVARCNELDEIMDAFFSLDVDALFLWSVCQVRVCAMNFRLGDVSCADV